MPFAIAFNIHFAKRHLLGVILFFFLLYPLQPAASQQAPEYHVKAVFLYNLTHFVNWPKKKIEQSQPFAICIYGPDPFGSILDLAIAKEEKYSNPLKVTRIDSPEDIPESCNILFVSKNAMDDWDAVRTRISGRPILSVSDYDDFTRQGGMVGLLKHEQKIQVEINHRRVRESGLSVSSKLLSLAVITE